MKAISVRQPWAWFILNAGKDVENRDWKWLCKERGNILIHASKGMTKLEYEEAIAFARSIGVTQSIPEPEQLKRGGIVGIVEIVSHVRSHPSKWFTGPTALVMRRAYPLLFQPCRGELGFFTPQVL